VRGLRGWTHRRWILAVICLLGILAAVTLPLLGQGSRGAEIANVLQFPISILALIAAVAAILAIPPPSPRPETQTVPEEQSPNILKRIRRHLTVKRAAILVVVVSLATSAMAWGPTLAERARIWSSGCTRPTELRVLTVPDQMKSVQQLADRYTQWTAQENYGCPTANAYVFPGAPKSVRNAIMTHWSGTSLRDLGPRPDVWFTESTEAERARQAATSVATDVPISQDDAIAWSPLVFGVSATDAAAFGDNPVGLSWSHFFDRAMDLGWDIVRPDPVSSSVGTFGAAVLYGTESAADPARARSVEQRIGHSLDAGRYPLGGDVDILCRYRQLGPPHTAAVVSEQALIMFNRGDPLGSGCGGRENQRARNDALLAFYATDGRAIEYRFVQFGWNSPPQDGEADAFRRWLASDEGERAVVDVGLRPSGGTTDHQLNQQYGVLPEAIVKRDPLTAEALDRALGLYESAHRRGRVLLALDGSGSMATSAGRGQGSRLEVAARGIVDALELMGERDEFGLWIFPDDRAGAARELVPIGPRDDLIGALPRREATGTALDQATPAGSTPLFRAIVDGVAAVGPSDDTRMSALVVLTDGEDTMSGLTSDQVREAVRGMGARVYVVTIGDLTCSAGVLDEITAVTGGRCVETDLASIDAELAELFNALWGTG
jgi:Bacterial extracellular solute-binding protein